MSIYVYADCTRISVGVIGWLKILKLSFPYSRVFLIILTSSPDLVDRSRARSSGIGENEREKDFPGRVHF